MVINPEKLRAFEDELLKKEKVDIERNFDLLDALYEESRALGAFSAQNPLEGIEVKIRIARTVNCVQRTD